MPRISIGELDLTEKGKGSDMSLYFKETYVKLCQPNKPPRWTKYQGCNPDGHSFYCADGTYIKVPVCDKNTFVEWSFPTGWFNLSNKSAVFCQRVPKRQFHKGISLGGNFSITSAEKLALDFGMLKSSGEDDDLSYVLHDGKFAVTVKILDSIFENPMYPPLTESYLSLKEKKSFSRALSREIAMMPHPENSDLIVLCHDIPVAEMVTKNKVKMRIPEFTAECAAYFNKEGVVVVS